MPEEPRSKTFKEKINFEHTKSELEKKGKKVFLLFDADVGAWGHVNKVLSEVMIQAVKEGWDGHYAGYTNLVDQLRNSIVDFEERYRKVGYSLEDVILTPGVAGSARGDRDTSGVASSGSPIGPGGGAAHDLRLSVAADRHRDSFLSRCPSLLPTNQSWTILSGCPATVRR